MPPLGALSRWLQGKFVAAERVAAHPTTGHTSCCASCAERGYEVRPQGEPGLRYPGQPPFAARPMPSSSTSVAAIAPVPVTRPPIAMRIRRRRTNDHSTDSARADVDFFALHPERTTNAPDLPNQSEKNQEIPHDSPCHGARRHSVVLFKS